MTALIEMDVATPFSVLSRHVLHVFPSFGIGGVPLRMVRVINHVGARLRHTVIALDNNFDAAEDLAGDFELMPPPANRNGGSLGAIVRGSMTLLRIRPDLLMTYNWGAIEWAMANRLLPVSRHLHIEAGFSQAEADRQLPRRVRFRRWALARCDRVVVPSFALEQLACNVWRLPQERVLNVPNGVDAGRFSALDRDAAPGFTRRPGELVVGTVAPLRPEKNVGRLLRVFARLDPSLGARLLVAGDGIEREPLERLAAELGIAGRVVFTGRVAPEAVLGSIDVFALSSDTEQMPNALLEAMAASRPVAAVDVGDVKRMVCDDNREFIVSRDDGSAFAAAISRLLRDPDKRRVLGDKNREKVVSEYSQERMLATFSKILTEGNRRSASRGGRARSPSRPPLGSAPQPGSRQPPRDRRGSAPCRRSP
jgi:L-malate glycosyltransferase